tara:strand:+ start:60 stop:659 length:600 start_codon:yes stop_codon:yes gene_type:complete
MKYITDFLNEAKNIIDSLDTVEIEKMIDILKQVRDDNGRLFFIGVGGGAGHASHAVNDFRKIACIESYTPTDNVSELTARINDDGWDNSYKNWLKVSKLNSKDCIFVFSVGGGNLDKNISVNIVNALSYAKENNSKIIGVVGKDGGYTFKVSDACILVKSFDNNTITPQVETFQALIWHLIVSHPKLLQNEMKWESTSS